MKMLQSDGVIKRTTHVWNAAFKNDIERFETILPVIAREPSQRSASPLRTWIDRRNGCKGWLKP